jgi:hypothetical protein
MKAERLIAGELACLGGTQAELELAARLPRETKLAIRELVDRLHLGSGKSAATPATEPQTKQGTR